MTARATYFCLDIETNGPVPALYDMVSVGISTVHEKDGFWSREDDLYLEFRPEAPECDPEAVAIHGLDLERLGREGLSRREGCSRIRDWVMEQTDPGTRPVFVGHNAPFDWSFIAWYFAAEKMDNPFGYKGMCTKSLSAGVLNLHWLDTNKETLSERLGLPEEDRTQKHRADYDARYQADLLIRLLEELLKTE